jgi:hypothetical protein
MDIRTILPWAKAQTARTHPLVLLIVLGLVLFSFHAKLSARDDDGRVGAFHGTREFTTSGAFVVPDNVSTVLVEIYGGGGGAGGLDTFWGCSGGEGAFSRSVIKVWPHSTLDISVGAGGAVGSAGAPGGSGGDGGDSSVSFHGFSLITAYGGKGGQGASPTTVCTSGIGAGGAADPTAMINHAGEPGGTGYQLLGFSLQGGLYSNSYTPISSAGSAGPGGPGYVLLTY